MDGSQTWDHSLFLHNSSSPPINLIYTRNCELFHETIYAGSLVYTHEHFSIACLNTLHHLVFRQHTTLRSEGDTTPLKTSPDQTATESRIVVDVSYSDLTLLVIIMNCFFSRTAMTTSHYNCPMIRRTDLTLTYVHHFLFTSTYILKLLDTNMTLTHHPTLEYDKRTSNS